MSATVRVSNPACTDGGPTWCCVDNDGTGLWCDSCLAWEAANSALAVLPAQPDQPKGDQ